MIRIANCLIIIPWSYYVFPDILLIVIVFIFFIFCELVSTLCIWFWGLNYLCLCIVFTYTFHWTMSKINQYLNLPTDFITLFIYLNILIILTLIWFSDYSTIVKSKSTWFLKLSTLSWYLFHSCYLEILIVSFSVKIVNLWEFCAWPRLWKRWLSPKFISVISAQV